MASPDGSKDNMAPPPSDATNAGALELAEALATRLCHDLAGLVGTIGGLLDLAADAPDEGRDTLPVARAAATTLRQRLRLLRAAWGPDTGDLDVLALAVAVGDARVSVGLDAAAVRHASGPGEARLLLNVILLGAEALRGTGRLTLRQAPTNAAPTNAAPTNAAPTNAAPTGAAREVVADILRPPSRARPSWPDLAQLPDPLAAGLADPRLFQTAWTVRLAAGCGALLRVSGASLHIRFRL